MKVPVPD